MALPVSISGISVAVAPVGPFKGPAAVSAGTPSVVLTVAPTLAGNENIGTTGQPRLGQSFTTDAVNTWYLTSISNLTLRKQGAPTDNFVVEIYAYDTGTSLPTGAALATSAPIAAASITTSFAPYTATFTSLVTLAPNTKYVFVFARSGALNSTNYYQTQNAIAGGYTGGNFHFQSSGLVWSTSTGADTAFTINAATSTITVDTYYFFARDGTTATTLQAYKSTAPDTSWASQTTKTGFTTAILNLAAYQAGNVIHMLVMDGTAATSVAVKYVSYDMATDAFLTTTETVLAAGSLAGQIGAAAVGCSLVYRPTAGHVVCFYNCVATNTSGTPRARVAYRIRTGVNTYGTETRVDANIAADNSSPIVVLGASDRVHFLFFNATNTIQRHLTSANVLGTAASTGTTTATQDVDTRDDAGTIRHVGFTAANAFRWASADNPTVTNTTMATGTPVRTVDSGTIVYALYQNSADGDLYVKTSSDNGATFGSGAVTFTGTVAAAATAVSKNQTAYTRGSATVFPYIVNDNGTLKYNEHTISAGVTHRTLTADTGAFAFAGQAVTLRYGHATVAATGAFAFSGQTATLAYGHKLISEAGAFAFSGQTVTLRYGHVLPAATGAFTFTGQDVTLRHGHKLTAATGAFTFDGQPVTLTYTLAAKTIVAETGAFAFAGQAADLDADRVLPAGTGTFAFAGQAANLQYGHKLQADTGSFAFTGQAASLRIARHLTAETGAFILTGLNVGLVQEGEAILLPAPGSFVFVGGDVEFRIGTVSVPVQPPVLVRPSRPKPPPPRLPQPIIGVATTAQGEQTVTGVFWVTMRAHVRIRETVFQTDAVATQAMSAAVLSAGIYQRASADVRMRMMSSARSFQKPIELDAMLEQAMTIRAITGGEVPLAPDYFEDYELPDAVDELFDA